MRLKEMGRKESIKIIHVQTSNSHETLLSPQICVTSERDKIYKTSVGKSEERNHLRDQCVNWRIILN
jgi:hypothetical protein